MKTKKNTKPKVSKVYPLTEIPSKKHFHGYTLGQFWRNFVLFTFDCKTGRRIKTHTSKWDPRLSAAERQAEINSELREVGLPEIIWPK